MRGLLFRMAYTSYSGGGCFPAAAGQSGEAEAEQCQRARCRDAVAVVVDDVVDRGATDGDAVEGHAGVVNKVRPVDNAEFQYIVAGGPDSVVGLHPPRAATTVAEAGKTGTRVAAERRPGGRAVSDVDKVWRDVGHDRRQVKAWHRGAVRVGSGREQQRSLGQVAVKQARPGIFDVTRTIRGDVVEVELQVIAGSGAEDTRAQHGAVGLGADPQIDGAVGCAGGGDIAVITALGRGGDIAVGADVPHTPIQVQAAGMPESNAVAEAVIGTASAIAASAPAAMAPRMGSLLLVDFIFCVPCSGSGQLGLFRPLYGPMACNAGAKNPIVYKSEA